MKCARSIALTELSTQGFPLTLVHHSIGVIAEVLGMVFIFKKFGKIRIWMRVTVILWTLAFCLGASFYLLYHII